MTNVFVENITTEVEIEAGYDLFEVVIEDFDQEEIRRYAEEAAISAAEALASEEAAADSADAALASEQSAAADAAQTAADRAVTNADRIVTTANAASTSADRVAVAADRAVTTANAATSTTQAGIATTKANEASSSASSALSSANTATTQAGIATTKAGQASASEIAAANSATSASNSASSATASASTATTQAGIATTQAGIATTQAGIATTKANEASASAAAALASETDAETAASTATTQAGIATTQAGIATTQAGIATTQAGNALTSADTATTQAGIATTQAGNALTSANNAAASAVAAANSASQAAQVGTSTTLLGYTVGANTAIVAADSILQAFQKTQGQINARVSGTGAAGQVAFWNGTTSQTGDNGLFWDNTNKRLGIGTIIPRSNLDVIGSTGIYQRDISGGNLVFDETDIADASTPMSFIRNIAGALQFGRANRNPANGLTTNSITSWQITNTGILQSNGAQTIQTSTGNLTLATAAGNGNIVLSPNGTGVVVLDSSTNNIEYAQFGRDIDRRLKFSNFINQTRNNAGHRINASDTSGAIALATNGTDKIFIHTNGNVGISTTTDAGFRLDVNGTARVSSSLTAASATFSQSAGNTLQVYQTSQTNIATAIIRQTGQGGNGNQDIGLVVDIQAAGNLDRIVNFRYFDGTNYNSRFVVRRDGNVGIGTTAPFAKLAIVTANNSIELNELTSTNSYLEALDTARTASNYFSIYNRGLNVFTRNGGIGSYVQSFTLTETGNLLVGTTTDAGFRLDVNGTARVQNKLSVGTPTATSAVMEITSTTQGFLPPRMTTAQRDAISSPAAGLVVYNTTTNVLNVYNGTMWI